MKAILLLAVLAVASAVVVEDNVELQFQSWRAEMGKFYATKEEYAYRLGVFAANLKIVEAHNAGNHSFLLGATRFADMTNAEYRQVMLPVTQDFTNFQYDGPVHQISGLAAPDNVDWRDQGAVNAIKDQGQCGSCYAFGAVAAMEAAWKMAGHALMAFSEQNIVDCSTSLGNQGCNGGWHYWAMDYVIKNGIMSMADYPYIAKQQTCKFDKNKVVGKIVSRTRTTQGSESALTDGVASHVMAIAIDASKNSFQLYKTGVYYEASCSSTSLDHAVSVVGYAPTYWIVRNSWGTSWGQKGYIFMSRNRNNNCGVATQAYYSTA